MSKYFLDQTTKSTVNKGKHRQSRFNQNKELLHSKGQTTEWGCNLKNGKKKKKIYKLYIWQELLFILYKELNPIAKQKWQIIQNMHSKHKQIFQRKTFKWSTNTWKMLMLYIREAANERHSNTAPLSSSIGYYQTDKI